LSADGENCDLKATGSAFETLICQEVPLPVMIKSNAQQVISAMQFIEKRVGF
jgi:hypothetical protein